MRETDKKVRLPGARNSDSRIAFNPVCTVTPGASVRRVHASSDDWNGVFLGTFLIGLREGLEATLIVGIIAAFLRKNGKPLRPLIVGVTAAVLLSIAVGVLLQTLSMNLPQAQQEALETVIGAIAVVFVTTMILWMNHHAKSMKRDLEHDASSALNAGGAYALAGMAFLAVVKEGFETAVFLLAAIQASQSSEALALIGAAAGILVAVAIGFAIYVGGLRLNLRKFFRITGIFLVFIAAGLVLNVFRTAHEAGWIVIGQQQIGDFSAWMPKTSVLGAVITGMFGIPTDPRLIEVLAWLAYLLPVLVIYFWPDSHTVPLHRRLRLKMWLAGGAVVLAAALFALVPRVHTDAMGDTLQAQRPGTAPGATISVRLTEVSADQITLAVDGQDDVTLHHVSDGVVGGVQQSQWETTVSSPTPSDLPTNPTVADLQRRNGGRLPSGLNFERTPGPFEAQWSQRQTYSARTSGSTLINAAQSTTLNAVLAGGGISGTKTVSVSGGLGAGWVVPDDEVAAVTDRLVDAQQQAAERALWWGWLPGVLLCVAAGLLLSGALDHRRAKDQIAEDAEAGVHPARQAGAEGDHAPVETGAAAK
ncbi:high-affinity Fe2+/Pb2+ permease [Pseudoclavibacter sp. CFCC 13611]|nr:high-affinity Fe2+/Pb2+ permease [Pseudoclavibacter sp. CFCC 13611]